jgi:hypothetical protein
MIQVESSTIKAVDYLGALYVLTIEFKNGSVYHYHIVESKVYKDFLKAESKGKYFHKHIRGKYDYKKEK